MLPTPAGTPAAPPAQPGEPRVVTEQDRALGKDLLERIAAAQKRHGDAFKRFEVNRKLLRGERDSKKMRANLFFANLATMRPQVYAKDPEFSVQPSLGVPEQGVSAVRLFCKTAEQVLQAELVKGANLKKRAKRILTSAYATSVGWWKLCWQEDPKVDPQIQNTLKSTQDNLTRLEAQKNALQDPGVGADLDLQIAKLQQTLAGLQSQTEVKVSRGLTLDCVMSEDILSLDPSVREFGDYLRSSALAHGVWMTPETYKAKFGYAPSKGKRYTEQSGTIAQGSGGGLDAKGDLLRTWEVWDQDSNRVHTVCDGEEGLCKASYSPEWTGERWYPFFGLAFNEIEGTFYPLSDIELTDAAIDDINIAAEDFKRDRKEALPVNLVREGGSITPDDVDRIKNRQGGDLIVIKGVGATPLSDDIFIGALAQLRPENYDTQQPRQFMEQIIGGGDASRGGILKAKTATEAEILSQGLRGRSAERTDTMEDLLTELGVYALEICLRKLTPEEVKRIAGPDAIWPQMTIEEIFDQVTLEVRGGSTGKPDRLQEQDRWTKVMPVIEKTISQVAELRLKGQQGLASALVELAKETLRRFDERIDIEQFLPPPPAEGQVDPAQTAQENAMLKAKLQEVTDELMGLRSTVDKGYISAAAAVATSASPATGALSFTSVLDQLENRAKTVGPGMQPPGIAPPGLSPQPPMGAPPQSGPLMPPPQPGGPPPPMSHGP